MLNFTFGSLVAQMVVSGIGFVFFRYGRKRGRSIFVTFGVILFIFPYFVSDLGWLAGAAAGLCALLYFLVKRGF